MSTGSLPAQNLNTQIRTGAAMLALPCAGLPISLEQRERHSRRLADGSLAVEYTTAAKLYRDSFGRVRAESETRDAAGRSLAAYVTLWDPGTKTVVVLLAAQDMAVRRPLPAGSGVHLSITDAADGQDSPHTWTTETKEIGKRNIDGIEFKGQQIITRAEDDSRLATTNEQWYSDDLKLIGAVERTGPERAYSIQIQNLRRDEPDPSLFRIPQGYRIVDLHP